LHGLSWVNAVMPVETNIIIFQVKPDFQALDVVYKLTEKGILCNTTNRDTIRFVLHLDISPEMVDQAIEILLHLQP
jgi:threonine aldolase